MCHGLPILAAFALFLHKRDQAQFTEQFGDLSGIQDFRDWVKRRLDIALRWRHSDDEKREALKHLALLSLRLPMSRKETDDLADASPLDASLLEVARTDRWIEDNQDQVAATHDVFADAIVAHYVFETRAVANTRLSELLRTAMNQNFLARSLLAIDRIAGHPDFEIVDATSLVRVLLTRAPVPVIAVHERLLRGRFLSDRGKVELLAEYPALHAAVLANRDCDAAVSKIAKSLARLRRHDPVLSDNFVEAAIQVIEPLVEAGVAYAHPSNMVLRRAFVLLPEKYKAAVLSRITKEPTFFQTNYLMIAWLSASLPLSEISPAVDLGSSLTPGIMLLLSL